MSGFRVGQFAGIIPRISPNYLPPNAAQTAVNARLVSGELRPLGDESFMQPNPAMPEITNVRTIFRYGQNAPDDLSRWLSFAEDVDIVYSPVEDDELERIYLTGYGAPKISWNTKLLTSPPTYYNLGVPAPSVRPSLSVDGVGALSERRAYVYTYVSSIGEEGPPSEAALVDVLVDTTAVTVTLSLSADNAAYVVTTPFAYNIAEIRIYRTATADTGTDYQLVNTITTLAFTSNITFVDNVVTSDLGIILPTRGYQLPPSNLQGIVSLPNGMLAAFEGRTVWMCEPYRPHTWQYFYSVDYDIVGLGTFGQNIGVITKGPLYIGTGTHPGAMSFQVTEFYQAGSSKRSIARVSLGVAYASPDGLCLLSQAGPTVVTAPLFTSLDWNNKVDPSLMYGYTYDNNYVGFYNKITVSDATKKGQTAIAGIGVAGLMVCSRGYTNEATNGYVVSSSGFMLDFSSNPPLWVDLDVETVETFPYTTGFSDLRSGKLFLSIGSANSIYTFDDEHNYPLTAQWKSKRFTVAKPTNFAAAWVDADSYPVTLKVYADGTLKDTKTVASKQPVKLSSGFKARDWELELTTTKNVRSVAIASTERSLEGIE